MAGFSLQPEESRGGLFSKCRTWRYQLWRVWGDGPQIAFIGLNPSTADEHTDDPTVRRCKNFAKDWGFGGMWMLNLFGLRSTDPSKLYGHDDPTGPDNDRWITDVIYDGKVKEVVLCWGNHGVLRNRYRAVASMVRNAPHKKMRVFALNQSGQPKHPLYLKKTQTREFIR